MKITIKQEVFKDFHPRLRVAFIIAAGINNKSKIKKANHLLAEMQKVVLLTFNKDTVKTHLLISPWIAIKEEFGKKARHYNTSVEKLLKKTLRKQKLQAKDTATTLLRYLALKHIVPFGADDPARIQKDLTFELKKGELQYRDAKIILGKKLDCWKNSTTALKPDSTSALIHFEFLPPISPAKQKEIVAETVELVRTFCGGKVSAVILDKKKNSITI